MAFATHPRRYAGRRPVAPARKLGTWKMAYADFLTALMAFFLMLWLVTGITPEDRAEIAAGFNGHGGLPQASLVAQDPEITRIFSALTLAEGLAAAGNSVVLTRTPDAVRVDLVDREARPLFRTGDGSLTPYGESLVAAAGSALAALPNLISVEGHSDAFAVASPGFTNWELSASRAGEARRALAAAGVSPDRFKAVSGLADTVPLNPGEPHAAANRRVSLLVHTRN